MMIVKSEVRLEIVLSPEDCILLAKACRYAADETQEDGKRPEACRTTSYLYYLMACTLDSYALVGDALTRLPHTDRDGFNLYGVATDYSPLPDARQVQP